MIKLACEIESYIQAVIKPFHIGILRLFHNLIYAAMTWLSYMSKLFVGTTLDNTTLNITHTNQKALHVQISEQLCY